MRGLVLIAAFLNVSLASPLLHPILDSEWEAFKLNFQKSYNGLSEEVKRYLCIFLTWNLYCLSLSIYGVR